jgi:multiple sugar transport system permease protein
MSERHLATAAAVRSVERARMMPLAARLRRAIGLVGAYLLLILVALGMAIPFLWMVLTSFKTPDQIFVYPPQFIPDPWTAENYVKVFDAIPMGFMIFNSTKITVLATFGALLSSSLAAYAFARMQFVGRNKLFIVLLATMMVPNQVTMIPVFLIMRALGWVDSHNALIVPYYFGSAFGIFLLRQFFLTISREMEDAAKIDGCNPWQLYWRIFLPLAKPALATLGVFSFLSHWNDLLGPVIYLTSWEKMTLTVGLATFRGMHRVEWELMMAGAMISVIPILVVFAVAQKYFVQGIALSGGLKG